MTRATTTIFLSLLFVVFVASACSSSGETTTTTMPTLDAATPDGSATEAPIKTTPTDTPTAAAATPTSAPTKATPAATATTAPANNTPAPTAPPQNTPAPTATQAPQNTPAPTATVDAGNGQTLPTADCEALLREAVSVDEADAYIELYYPSLAQCTGLDDWVAAVNATSALPGEDPIEWAANVCALDGPMTSITCQEAIAAARGDNGGNEGALPTADCEARLQEAVSVDEADQYIELYYPALKVCTGLDDWVAAVAATSAFPGEDPVAWASKVCGVDGPMNSVTCQEAMAASPIE